MKAWPDSSLSGSVQVLCHSSRFGRVARVKCPDDLLNEFHQALGILLFSGLFTKQAQALVFHANIFGANFVCRQSGNPRYRPILLADRVIDLPHDSLRPLHGGGHERFTAGRRAGLE
jgi:hypothetical protein